MIETISATTFIPSPPASGQKTDDRRLEQAFMEEVMKYIRPGSSQDPFSDEKTGSEFDSLLDREYAARLCLRLDFGIGVNR